MQSFKNLRNLILTTATALAAAAGNFCLQAQDVIDACYYGIDFPDPKDLIAARMDVEEIRKKLELDSLGYLSLEGMLSAGSKPPENYCTGCWSGKYVVPPVDAVAKDIHERPPAHR